MSSREARTEPALTEEVLHGVLDPMLVLDDQLRVLTANEAFYNTFPLTPDQTLGQPLYRLGDGEWDIPPLRELLQATLQENRTLQDVEIVHVFSTVGRRIMLLNARKIQSRLNGRTLIVLAMRDVTARREVEQALSYKQQTLQMIFENAHDFAIIGMDNEGRVITWNRGAEQLLGYRESEAIGRDGRFIFTEEDRARGEADAEFNTALEKGRAENERWHVRKDGSRFWGSGLVMPLRDQRGEIRGLTKIMRDLTEQHQMQQEREAWAKQLEQRVKEAVAESEERARQLQELTEHLNQVEQTERRRLAGLLHDDLQQLLAAARMRLQRIKTREGQESRVREAVKLLEEAIEAARSLSHELNPSVLRDSGLVPALHWLAEQIHQRHQLTVHVEAEANVAEDLAADIGDALYHMVRELLFNIVKHARASQAWIYVDTTPERHLRITVEDDGIGCDPDQMTIAKAGLGLRSIHERLRIWRGWADISQRSGGGCRVVLQIPSRSGPH